MKKVLTLLGYKNPKVAIWAKSNMASFILFVLIFLGPGISALCRWNEAAEILYLVGMLYTLWLFTIIKPGTKPPMGICGRTGRGPK